MSTDIAIKFIKKELHGHTDAETIISYIKKNGFSVVFYDLNKDRDILERYNILNYTQTFKNFTINNKYCHIVFICDRLPSIEKHLALIHEAAHIYIGHLNENVHLVNERKNEAEAEAFAYTVFTYKKNDIKKRYLFGISMLFVLCTFVILSISKYAPKPVALNQTPITYAPTTTPSETITPVSDNNIVYVTPTGSKYHRRDCHYTKDKKCIELTIEQAQIKYEPCKVCKPQYN